MSIFHFPKYFLEFFIKVFFWDFWEKKYFCEHNYFFSEKFVSIIFFWEKGTEKKVGIFWGIRSWGFFVIQSNPFPHFWLTKKPQLFWVFFLFWAFLEFLQWIFLKKVRIFLGVFLTFYFLGFFGIFTVNFFEWRSEFFWVFFCHFIFWAFLEFLQWIFLDEGPNFFGCFLTFYFLGFWTFGLLDFLQWFFLDLEFWTLNLTPRPISYPRL